MASDSRPGIFARAAARLEWASAYPGSMRTAASYSLPRRAACPLLSMTMRFPDCCMPADNQVEAVWRPQNARLPPQPCRVHPSAGSPDCCAPASNPGSARALSIESFGALIHRALPPCQDAQHRQNRDKAGGEDWPAARIPFGYGSQSRRDRNDDSEAGQINEVIRYPRVNERIDIEKSQHREERSHENRKLASGLRWRRNNAKAAARVTAGNRYCHQTLAPTVQRG